MKVAIDTNILIAAHVPDLAGHRIADTLFAATLKRHEVRALWTRNKSDFSIFPFLEPLDPII